MRDVPDSTSRRGLPAGVVAIPFGAGSRAVWSFAWGDSGRESRRVASALRKAGAASSDIAGVVVDLTGCRNEDPDVSRRLLEWSAGLERRGVVVVAVGMSADLFTSFSMDLGRLPLPVASDLSQAIGLLRRLDELRARVRVAGEEALGVLHAPARPESVALACRTLGDRVAEAGLTAAFGLRISSRVREVLHEEVIPACDGGRDVLAISTSVHAGRVTVTVLDDGEGERPRPRPPQGFDRVHRFRILGRHHATILEWSYSAGDVAERTSSSLD